MEIELQFTENMIRGKRTRRPRPCSPFDSNGEHCLAATSEEDEDMANCLILLAQSVCVSPIIKEEKTDPIRYKTEKINSRKLTDITSGNKSGYYVYECKTCNRSFPSFQALGGHRASHKKPKLNIEEKEAESMVSLETHDQNNNNRVNDTYEKSPSPDSSPAPAQIRISVHDSKEHNNKPKVHECSICGSEFLSGQALGGHMRKHRPIQLPINRATSSIDDDKSGDHSVFSLDLNLPPPEMMEDIVVQSKFESFKTSSQQQRLMFSSPALVDCPY